MQGKKILVVDDDLTTRMVIKHIARTLVDNIIEAKNGDEAIRYLQSVTAEERPALLLVDVYMPYMDGIVFCRKLKELELFPLDRVLIISSADRQVEKAAIGKLGIGGFLQKPFSPDDVRRELSSRL